MTFSDDEINFLHALKEISFRINRIKKECEKRKVWNDINDVENKLNELYVAYTKMKTKPFLDRKKRIAGIKFTFEEGWFKRLINWLFKRDEA